MMTKTMRRNYVTYKGVKRMNYAIREKEREYSKQNNYESPEQGSDIVNGIALIFLLGGVMFFMGMGWMQPWYVFGQMNANVVLKIVVFIQKKKIQCYVVEKIMQKNIMII